MEPPWCLRIEDEAPLTTISVVSGSAYVIPDGAAPIRLGTGDIAIARGPDPYTVADDPATAPQAIIGPGQVCRLADGQELKLMDFLGTRTWGNSAAGGTVLLT